MPKFPEMPWWIFLIVVGALLIGGGTLNFRVILEAIIWIAIIVVSGGVLLAALFIIGLIVSPFVSWPKKTKKGGRR